MVQGGAMSEIDDFFLFLISQMGLLAASSMLIDPFTRELARPSVSPAVPLGDTEPFVAESTIRQWLFPRTGNKCHSVSVRLINAAHIWDVKQASWVWSLTVNLLLRKEVGLRQEEAEQAWS